MAKEKVDKSIEVVLKNLKGFMKKGSEIKDPTFVSTGHYKLDLAIAHGISPKDENADLSKIDLSNFGGLPMGKLVELAGAEGCGKSSLAYRVVGIAQQKNLKCLWIDAEHSYSKSLAKINGVNTDELFVSELIDTEDTEHMYCAEEIFDRICDSIEAGFKVIILDSVANLTTKAEMENYIADGGVGIGQLAQVLSKGLKKIIAYADKHDALVIFINQLREKIGVLFGSNESTPGGRALKHLCSVRLKMNKLGGADSKIEKEEEQGFTKVIGGKVNVWIHKNRFGAPVTDAVEIPIYYTYHFPQMEEIIFDTARALQVVRVYKGEYRWEDFSVAGKNNFITQIKERGEFDNLILSIHATAKEEKYPLPPEVLTYKVAQKEVEENAKTERTEETVSGRRKKKDT